MLILTHSNGSCRHLSCSITKTLMPADFAAATLSGHGIVPMALKGEEDGEGTVLRVRSVAEGAEGVFRFLDRECTVTARTFAPQTYLIDKDGTHRTNLLEDAIETY